MVNLFAKTSTSKRLKIASQNWVGKPCKHCEHWIILAISVQTFDNDGKY